ncbi:hypothetical protein D3C71_1983090 [compost metagenome]
MHIIIINQEYLVRLLVGSMPAPFPICIVLENHLLHSCRKRHCFAVPHLLTDNFTGEDSAEPVYFPFLDKLQCCMLQTGQLGGNLKPHGRFIEIGIQNPLIR